MNIERTLETYRLRLLRLVAGWLVAVAFVSFVPFSHAVSRWVGEGIFSMLSRVEAAAQCLVIVQARLIAARTGSDVDPERVLDGRALERAGLSDDGSLNEIRERLEALKALLEDLPRFGLRLLRQTEKRVRRLLRTERTHQTAPCGDMPLTFGALRLVDVRIERPPDK